MQTATQQEFTKYGSLVKRSLDMFSTKQDHEFRKQSENGWISMKTGSDHLGYWFNESLLQIFCFCEGDIIEYICPSIIILDKELFSIRDFLDNHQ